ncbi:MAG: DoxX family protein [Bacteroidia bacterium]
MNKSFILAVFSSVKIQSLGLDLLLAIPRITAGLVLSFGIGLNKFGMPWSPKEKDLSLFQVSDGFVDYIAESDLIFSAAPLLFAWLAGFAEAVSGILMAIGFKTRLNAFLIFFTMLVALSVHWADPLHDKLGSLAFLWISIYVMILGSGRFGLDYLIHNWLNKKA